MRTYNLRNKIGRYLAATAITAITAGCAENNYNSGAMLFYDQNNNRVADIGEAHIPNALVKVGDAGNYTDSTGHASLAASSGSHTLTVDEKTLPPYYKAGPVPITVPSAEDVPVPASLPIGDNRPNTYMGFGDSITAGNNGPEESWLRDLDPELRNYLGTAIMINAGIGGTKSRRGSERAAATFAEQKPAYGLVLYGTNDWNDPLCREPFRESGTLGGCDTIANLRYIIRTAKANGSLPVVGTIPPVNEGYDDRVPPERNKWVAAMNKDIIRLAREEEVPVADVFGAFTADTGYAGNPSSYFDDHVHPTAKGRKLIAGAFFRAVTQRPDYPLFTE